jgi:hypothetical protein
VSDGINQRTEGITIDPTGLTTSPFLTTTRSMTRPWCLRNTESIGLSAACGLSSMAMNRAMSLGFSEPPRDSRAHASAVRQPGTAPAIFTIDFFDVSQASARRSSANLLRQESPSSRRPSAEDCSKPMYEPATRSEMEMQRKSEYFCPDPVSMLDGPRAFDETDLCRCARLGETAATGNDTRTPR